MRNILNKISIFLALNVAAVNACEFNDFHPAPATPTVAHNPTIAPPLAAPLVFQNEGANIHASPLYQELLDNGALELIDLSYELAKAFSTAQKTFPADISPHHTERLNTYLANCRSTLQAITKSGWKVNAFFGTTGYAKDQNHHGDIPDLRGVVAAKTGLIIVAPHGSKDANDWAVNLDARIVTTSSIGLSIEGDPSVHRGFGHAVAGFQVSLEQVIRNLLPIAGPEYNIIAVGHSQGAAIASILLLHLSDKFAKNLWGKTYSNPRENRIKGMLFSAPRAIKESSLGVFNTLVGKENVIRQNVDLDPVPKLSPRVSNTFLGLSLQIAKYFPFVCQKPQFASLIQSGLKEYVGLIGVGYLALDSAIDVITRTGTSNGVHGILGLIHYVSLFPNWESRLHHQAINTGSDINKLLQAGLAHQKSKLFHNRSSSHNLHDAWYILADSTWYGASALRHLLSAFSILVTDHSEGKRSGHERLKTSHLILAGIGKSMLEIIKGIPSFTALSFLYYQTTSKK